MKHLTLNRGVKTSKKQPIAYKTTHQALGVTKGLGTSFSFITTEGRQGEGTNDTTVMVWASILAMWQTLVMIRKDAGVSVP